MKCLFCLLLTKKKKLYNETVQHQTQTVFILSVTQDFSSLTVELTSPCTKVQCWGGSGVGVVDRSGTERTEHVQSGCYINMLAQCGTLLRSWTRGNEELGDQAVVTHTEDWRWCGYPGNLFSSTHYFSFCEALRALFIKCLRCCSATKKDQPVWPSTIRTPPKQPFI